MSSHHRFNSSSGEIKYTNYLLDDIRSLYLSDHYSDITLVVNGQRFNAHKVILAARSQYFRALLFGGLKESSQSQIELKEPVLPAFKELLKYIYTGHMSLANQTEEVILDILGLTHQYGFIELQSFISEYLKEIHNIKNICIIFDAARLYQLDSLIKVCYEFMDKHTLKIMQHKSFLQLSSGALIDLLTRNSFYALEIEIFKAVHLWVQANPGAEVQEVLKQVRLSLISVSDLLNIVRPTTLISAETILDAIAVNTQVKHVHLHHRGLLLIDENIARSCHGAHVLRGESSYLLNGDNEHYDMERGFTWHKITDSQDNCILIKLGTQCIINHIKMLLWDLDERSYSYYIEVSMDEKDWKKVIDYSHYFCRSWQYLYFEPQVVLYIRIIGTNNTVNKVFHVVSFEAYFTHYNEKLSNGIIIPSQNVAVMKRSACVTEGVSRSRNTLLNGDSQNYNWEHGYTCHQLNSGCIQIQLGQPYIIDSMRLLLWDCDERSYSYYIQVSDNLKNWEVIIDKTKESCQSWQILHFSPPRPIVFIRIVGTHNTANEVFHCVHFECPAQINEIKKKNIQHSKLLSKNELFSENLPYLITPPPPTEGEIAGERINNDNEDN